MANQDNTDLLNQLLQWSANGGGRSPNGASSTDTQGDLNQNMSPIITTDATQSISGGKNNQGNVNTMQNWHGDNTPMTPGKNGQPDLISLLSGLIQKGLEVSGGTDAKTSESPQLHPIAQAAEDGAVKATKEQAYQAVVQGGPEVAKHIVDTYGSGDQYNFGGTQVDPQQSINNTTNQQNDYGYKPDNPVSKFFNMLGIQPSPDAQVNLTQASLNRQKLAGQQPLQQEDIQRAALDTQTKINQALMIPPTQAEKLQNAAAYAGYKTTALKDMLDNTDKVMSQQNDIIKNMQGYNSWFNKPFGAMPKEAQSAVKKLQQLQLERIAVSSELNKHQQLLASGGVSTSPFKEGQVYTDANGNTATFRNGKFQ